MSYESQLCRKFVLSAEWDRAVAAVSGKGYVLTCEDYANRAYARCFQATNAHKNSNYDDAIEDASQALLKDCSNNRALCIRAYAYYLNNNYEAAITDCEKVIERTTCTIEAAQQEIKGSLKEFWEKAIEQIFCDGDGDADAKKQEMQKLGDDVWEKIIKQILCDIDTKKAEMKRLWKIACEEIAEADKAAKEAAQAAAEDAKKAVEDAQADADTAVQAAADAQEAYCAALRPAAFVNELLGKIYADMGNNLEARKHYKLALLARQTDIESASPLLMDAYRNARAAVKSVY